MKKTTFVLMVITILLAPLNYTNAESLSSRMKGKILLQVEENGEGWYVNPDNQQRYFLGRPNDAFNIMRELGLGISESSYNSFNGYAPLKLSGKILLRVEANGEAYYVNPEDLKMHYLGRPNDAFQVMRNLGLGITNNNLVEIGISEESTLPSKEEVAVKGIEYTAPTPTPKEEIVIENFRENVIIEYAKTIERLKQYKEYIESFKPIYNDRIDNIQFRITVLENTKFSTLPTGVESFDSEKIIFNSIVDKYIASHRDDIKNCNSRITSSDNNYLSWLNKNINNYESLKNNLLNNPNKIVPRETIIEALKNYTTSISPNLTKISTGAIDLLETHIELAEVWDNYYTKTDAEINNTLNLFAQKYSTTALTYQPYQPAPVDTSLTWRQELLLNPITCHINSDPYQTTVSCY